MAKINRKDLEVGRWVSVRWSDVGNNDCIVAEKVNREDKTVRVIVPRNSWGVRSVELSQITKVGNFVMAEGNGLE